MPASPPTERKAGAASGSGTSWTVVPATNCTAGNTLILVVATLATASGPASVTDTKGNTWTVDHDGSSTDAAFICSTRQDAGALTTGDTITINFNSSASTVEVWLEEFSGVYINDKSAGNQPISGTSFNSGTTAATTDADEFAIVVFAVGKSGGGTTWTWTKDANYSNFTTAPPLPTGSRTSSSAAGYRILTATGTQSATYTTSATTNAGVGLIATYKASGPPTHNGAVTIAGSGAVSASAQREAHAAATIHGAGAAAITGQRSTFAAATLAGAGAIIATGSVTTGGTTVTGAVTIHGAGALSASGQRTAIGSATLAGLGHLSVSSLRTALSAVTLHGIGTLGASGQRTSLAAATLHGTGTLSVAGQRSAFGSATLRGVGALSATGSVSTGPANVTGAVTLSGAGSLSAAGKRTAIAATTLHGIAALSVGGSRTARGAVTLHGVGALVATGGIVRVGAVTLAGAGSLTATGERFRILGPTLRDRVIKKVVL